MGLTGLTGPSVSAAAWGLTALMGLTLAGCAPGGGPAPGRSAAPTSAPSSEPTSASSAPARPCTEAGFRPEVRAEARRGTRVAVYALPLTLEPGRRGRVPVTLRRVVDLRPGVRPPVDAAVDPGVLRAVATRLPGSTGPLSETFATEVVVRRPAPRPRRVVAYAVTRARPLTWTAEVCGPPTTTDGSTARVEGTGLVVGRFATGRLDCDAAAAGDPVARQVRGLC